MSAVQRLPMVAGTLTFGASLAAIAGIPALRYRFTDLLSRGATGKMLRLLVVAYALLNLKNLPFIWHVRFRQTLLLQKSWSTLKKSRRKIKRFTDMALPYNSGASSKASSTKSSSKSKNARLAISLRR